MMQFLMIALREGLESFLAVAMASLYLRRSGQAHLLSALRAGVSTAVALSVAAGVAMARLGQMSPVAEGWLALIAVGSVMACLAHASKAGKAMGGIISGSLSTASAKKGGAAWWAVFGFCLLMVGREGLEAAAMGASFSAKAESISMVSGSLLGLTLAALLAWLWSKHGRKIEISKFFAASAFFMSALSIQLLAVAAHAFSEAGALFIVDNARVKALTENFAEGSYAQIYAFAIIALPAAWLALSRAKVKLASKP